MEHESGPELITYATAVVGLTAGFVGLIAAVVNARSQGVKRGDKPDAPIEVIVRGYYKDGTYFEERVLKINSTEKVTPEIIEKALSSHVQRVLNEQVDANAQSTMIAPKQPEQPKINKKSKKREA